MVRKPSGAGAAARPLRARLRSGRSEQFPFARSARVARSRLRPCAHTAALGPSRTSTRPVARPISPFARILGAGKCGGRDGGNQARGARGRSAAAERVVALPAPRMRVRAPRPKRCVCGLQARSATFFTPRRPEQAQVEVNLGKAAPPTLRQHARSQAAAAARRRFGRTAKRAGGGAGGRRGCWRGGGRRNGWAGVKDGKSRDGGGASGPTPGASNAAPAAPTRGSSNAASVLPDTPPPPPPPRRIHDAAAPNPPAPSLKIQKIERGGPVPRAGRGRRGARGRLQPLSGAATLMPPAAFGSSFSARPSPFPDRSSADGGSPPLHRRTGEEDDGRAGSLRIRPCPFPCAREREGGRGVGQGWGCVGKGARLENRTKARAALSRVTRDAAMSSCERGSEEARRQGCAAGGGGGGRWRKGLRRAREQTGRMRSNVARERGGEKVRNRRKRIDGRRTRMAQCPGGKSPPRGSSTILARFVARQRGLFEAFVAPKRPRAASPGFLSTVRKDDRARKTPNPKLPSRRRRPRAHAPRQGGLRETEASVSVMDPASPAAPDRSRLLDQATVVALTSRARVGAARSPETCRAAANARCAEESALGPEGSRLASSDRQQKAGKRTRKEGKGRKAERGGEARKKRKTTPHTDRGEKEKPGSNGIQVYERQWDEALALTKRRCELQSLRAATKYALEARFPPCETKPTGRVSSKPIVIDPGPSTSLPSLLPTLALARALALSAALRTGAPRRLLPALPCAVLAFPPPLGIVCSSRPRTWGVPRGFLRRPRRVVARRGSRGSPPPLALPFLGALLGARSV